MTVTDVGEGEVVVLGHGYLLDASLWRPQIEVLAARYRVIVPELWGHGGSGSLPPQTRDMGDIAQQHLELLDRLGVDRFALVGLSAGGMWGAELALRAPDRLSGLALLGTFVGPEPAQLRDRYHGMQGMVEQTGEFPEPLLDALVPLYFSADFQARHPDIPAAFRAALRGWSRARLLDSLIPFGRMIFDRRDALPELQEFPFPVVVMTGAADRLRSVQEGRLMAEQLRCPFLEIPEAGHLCSLEAPEVVTRHLEDLLKRAWS